MSVPLNARFSVTPLFEWRHDEYPDTTTTSVFGTGDLFAGGLLSTLQLSDHVKLESHSFFRRGTAAAMATKRTINGLRTPRSPSSFASPLTSSPYDWSLSPFARYLHTAFDSPNPFIDPLVVHIDNEWTGGMVVSAPINRTFGITATAQYDYIGSTLPNYRLQNLSLMAGPTASLLRWHDLRHP